MFLLFVICLAVIAAAVADPSLPEMPSQYTVKNVAVEMFTNAGYPPHYTETDSAQYYDYVAQKTRTDVAESSYGTKAPYSIIKDYSQNFPVDCGHDGEYQAPRGYLVQGGQCCYTPLIQDCPAAPGYFPNPDTMFVAALPKMVKYDGVVSNPDVVANGAEADLWESVVMLKQTVPFMTQDFYFDTSDHTSQLGNAMYLMLEASNQFINATTTYTDGKDAWTMGAPDASVFDVSAYDCSKQCKSSSSAQFFVNAHSQTKRLTQPKREERKPVKTANAVRGSTCESISSESTCMSSSEGDEACSWCTSGAVGTSCQKESDAQSLPSAVFECSYQAAYAAYTTDTVKSVGAEEPYAPY